MPLDGLRAACALVSLPVGAGLVYRGCDAGLGPLSILGAFAVLIGLASPAFSQERLELPIIQSPFHRSWQPRDLGMPSHLPALHSVEGLTFDPQSGKAVRPNL